MTGQLLLPFLNRIAEILGRPAAPLAHARGDEGDGLGVHAAVTAARSDLGPVERRQVDARKRLQARERGPSGMQARYDAVVEQMKARHEIRIHRWRKNMSGKAWTLHYRDGRVTRLIEAPYPKGPMSAAIFLHEVGHHALGIGFCSPRCLEEYHAWRWSLETMQAFDLNITDAVIARRDRSLRYAVAKAVRRGMRRVPEELAGYLPAGVTTK